MNKKALKQQYTKDDATGCWVWHGLLGAHGTRPMLRYKDTEDTTTKSKVWYAAPLLWALVNKAVGGSTTVPKGKHLKNTCGNPLCVSPQHHALQDKHLPISAHQFASKQPSITD